MPVSISEALAEIDPDEDSASLYQDLFKSLGVEEGTEYLLENIKIVPTPRSTGTDDVLRFYLPEEVMGLIDTTDIIFSGDTEQGEDFVEIDVEEIDRDGSDVGIKYLIDKILIASNNAYNNPSGRKKNLQDIKYGGKIKKTV